MSKNNEHMIHRFGSRYFALLKGSRITDSRAKAVEVQDEPGCKETCKSKR